MPTATDVAPDEEAVFSLTGGFGVTTRHLSTIAHVSLYEVQVHISHVVVYTTEEDVDRGAYEGDEQRCREAAAHHGLHRFAQKLRDVLASD